MRIDFELLFQRSPNPYMLLDRDLRYVAANEAYLRVTATRPEDLTGRYVFEVFPNDPDDPNNESVQMLRRSLERTIRTGETDVLALIRYRVPQHTEQGIELADRYFGHWDCDRLAQLVGNLLGNAFQHGSPGGSVTLRTIGGTLFRVRLPRRPPEAE